MELPVQHPALDGSEGGHMQVQPDVGCFGMKVSDGFGNVAGRVASGFVEHRHLQLPAHALVDFVHAAAECVSRSQQLGGLGIDFFALSGERKAGPSATAQGQAEAGFQVLDVAAHRGRADVELKLGGGHAPAIDHRLEDAQQAQIHVADLAENGFGFCW